MSCWVVPALAAEIWGIPLQQVLEAIRTGTLPTRSAIGLTFVDVAPAGRNAHSRHCTPTARPKTFRDAPLIDELTARELGALAGDSREEPPAREDELTSTVDEHEDGRLDWRASRRAAARLRRPPARRAA